jgi:hypothetical protein
MFGGDLSLSRGGAGSGAGGGLWGGRAAVRAAGWRRGGS